MDTKITRIKTKVNKIWTEENIKKHLASDNRSVNVYYKKLGKRDCMMCEKKFDTYGKFDKFCETCKKSNYFRGNEIYV